MLKHVVAPKASAMARKRHALGFVKKSQQEAEEISRLDATIEAGAPEPGTNPLSLPEPAANGTGGAEAATASTSYAAARKFEDLPLSRYTLDALRASKYTTLTAIQRAALPHALAGRDVLGAAKTGSGKTLAFLIPVRSPLPGAARPAWNRLALFATHS